MIDEGMYREQLMELYRNPSNCGTLEKSSGAFEGANPLCGDRVSFQILMDGNILKDIAFSGSGCAISIASTSLITDKVKGMKREEILALTSEEVIDLLGVELGPSRVKCALLSLKSIQEYLLGEPK